MRSLKEIKALAESKKSQGLSGSADYETDEILALCNLIEGLREYGARAVSFANCCDSADIPVDYEPFDEIIDRYLGSKV